jgi:hypothetical protein
LRRFGSALAIASCLCLAASTSAFGSSLMLVEVSANPSPYATCTFGAGGSSALNYTNAELEPSVTMNPANSNNLIGAWQQDRWSDGGSHGLVAGFSSDGGKTWSQTDLPFNLCAPGGLNYTRASDPWVSIGPDGTAYTVSISFDETDFRNAVAAATSSDGGASWKNLNVIKADTSSQFFNDKESVTADPVHTGVAYAVWDRLAAPNGIAIIPNPDEGAHNFFGFTGPTWFSKTMDGGKDWSTPAIINDVSAPTSQENQTIGNVIVVDPRTDTLYDFFDAINGSGSNGSGQHGFNVAFQKSTNGGDTWTTPQIISTLGTVFVTDPNTGQSIRTGDIIPEPAIDPATGQLYVVWQDARFSGGHFDQVAISTSTDGGATWSTPVRVNTPKGQPAFTASVAVNSDHTVGVTYYDFRELTANNTRTLPTDYWIKTFSPGQVMSGGIDTTVLDTHVAGPFNMLAAPFASGFFVGDYEGLTAVGTSFHPFFAQVNCDDFSCATSLTSNRTDIFTSST